MSYSKDECVYCGHKGYLDYETNQGEPVCTKDCKEEIDYQDENARWGRNEHSTYY